MSVEIIKGNLLDAKEKYLVHQCNCITNRAAHLVFDVFNCFPYADIYSVRTSPDTLGSIVIRGNGNDQRYVVSILGQYYPGHIKYSNSEIDGIKVRQKAFYRGLLKLSKVPNLESVAFPVGIGCGAAGGNWEYYFGTIKNFAEYIHDAQQVKVVLYELK